MQAGCVLRSCLYVFLLGSILSATENPAFSGRPELYLSYSGGYTHYRARELNQVMLSLRDQSAEQGGLNRYNVDTFDGHPRQSAAMGVQWRGWTLALEGEFWVESFSQDDIPFYVGRERDPLFVDRTSLNCADFVVEGFTPVQGGVAGCIDAREVFTIVPITLQIGHTWPFFGDHLRLGAAYGLGVLAGDARVIVSTDFIGADARPDDHLELTLWPGINPVQKLVGDLEYRPLPYLGIGLRGGWRWMQMQKVELSKKEGESFLFSLILGEDSQLEEGDVAWLVRNRGGDENILVIRGAPSEQEKQDYALAGSYFDRVQGDFDGWFAEARIIAWFDLDWLR